jgi:hypothetical protein
MERRLGTGLDSVSNSELDWQGEVIADYLLIQFSRSEALTAAAVEDLSRLPICLLSGAARRELLLNSCLHLEDYAEYENK